MPRKPSRTQSLYGRRIRWRHRDLVPLAVLLSAVVVVPGFVMWRYSHQPVRPQVGVSGATSQLTGTTASSGNPRLETAVDRLLADIDPDDRQNVTVPAFARSNVQWLLTRYRSRTLSIAVVEDFREVGPGHDGLMTSVPDGSRPTIIIGKPQLLRLLSEGNGSTVGPFTPEQRNDFMLSVVHQALHLRKSAGDSLAAELPVAVDQEERRVWREVTVNIVRPMRIAGAPLHQTYIDVDDAFRRCDDRIECLELPTFNN